MNRCRKVAAFVRSTALPACLLLMATLTPAATAQDTSEWFTLAIDPVPSTIPPLGGVVMTNATATVNCALAKQSMDRLEIAFNVDSGPSWATIVVLPEARYIDTASCPLADPIVRAGIAIAASDRAPAFAAEPFAISASTRGLLATYSARDESSIEASFFGIIDSQVDASIQHADPGDSITSRVTIRNVGNAATEVTIRASEVPKGWMAGIPGSFILESHQEGGAETDRTLALTFAVPEDAMPNTVHRIAINITSAPAARSDLVGDHADFTLLLRIPGASAAFNAPGPSGLLLAPAVVALAVALRGRNV